MSFDAAQDMFLYISTNGLPPMMAQNPFSLMYSV